MGVKRKRSFDSSPSSVSSIAASSCRESTSPTPMPRQLLPERAMEMDVPRNMSDSSRTDHLAATLNSRTRKRWRDNRPDDIVVHRNTIDMLFAAQRQHRNPSPIPSHGHASKPMQPTGQRSTLHSFWNLPPPLAVAAAQSHQPEFEDPELPKCADCDQSLPTPDDMDLIMEYGDTVDVFSCYGCRRRVCDMCAVSMDGRRCLPCASEARR